MRKIIPIILITFPIISHADWHLVYKTDLQGNVVSGSVCSLSTYIKNGYATKVIIDGENYATNTSWHVSITPLAVAFKDNYIYARAANGVSEYYNSDGLVDFKNDNINDMYRAESMVDSTGRLVTLTYSLNGDRLMHRKTIIKVATKWFVDTSSPLISSGSCQ